MRTRTAPRRGVSRVEAAQYIGVSPTKFDELVQDRQMPGPKRIGSRRVWDLHALDRAFDELPDHHPVSREPNPWDRFHPESHQAKPTRRSEAVDEATAFWLSLSDLPEKEREPAVRARHRLWAADVREQPLRVREQRVLNALAARRAGERLRHTEIKGAGPNTIARLLARGFIGMTLVGSSEPAEQLTLIDHPDQIWITPAGLAAGSRLQSNGVSGPLPAPDTASE